MAGRYNPVEARDIGQALFAYLVFVLVLGLSTVWWWRAERRMIVSQGESFWRVYRRVLWRRGWRCFVLTAAIAMIFAFSGRDPEEAGQKMGSIIALYPFLFTVIAVTTWRATTRRLGGQSRAAVWTSNVAVALIAAGLIGFGLIAIGTVFVAMCNLSTYRSDVPTVPHTVSLQTAATVCADIASSLRDNAAKMTQTLVGCGISSDEARRIVMYKMPHGYWWDTEFLPRLNQEQQRIVTRGLEQYREVGQKSAKNVILAHLYEIAICQGLQEAKRLSINEVYDVWHAGVCNQSEEWWKAQLVGLQPAKQDELNKLRKNLMEIELGG